MKAPERLEEAANTYRVKSLEYGDNYHQIGFVLEALFPSGIAVKTAQDWNRLHILICQLIKLTRYCVNFEKGGHPDSTRDLIVYSAMLEELDAQYKNQCDNSRNEQGRAPDKHVQTTDGNRDESSEPWREF